MHAGEIPHAFGIAVKTLRERRGISQSALAKAVPLSRRYLISIEKGEVDPMRGLMVRIAQALGVRLRVLDAEMDHHLSDDGSGQLGLMLPGGIASFYWSGRLNLANCMRFHQQVFRIAQGMEAWKVLLNLAAVEFDFTDRGYYDATMKSLDWFREQRYWPLVAVVGNDTLDVFGMEIASQHGLAIAVFNTSEEAIAWLESHDPPTPPWDLAAR